MFNLNSIKGKVFSGGQGRVMRNSGWLFLGDIVGLVAKFFLFVHLARVLGPSDFGDMTFALAFVSFFVIGADVGLGTLVNQLYAKTNGTRYTLGQVLGLKLVLMMVAFGLLLAVSFSVPGGQAVQQLVVVFGMFIMVQSFVDLLNSFFRAREQMQYEARIKIVQTVLVVGVVVAFLIWSDIAALSVAKGYVVGVVLALGYAVYLFTRQIAPISFQVNKSAWRNLLEQSWPLGLVAFFAMLYNTMDSVLLGYFNQLESVGLYNAALKIVGVVILPVTVVIKSAFSAWSRLASEKTMELKRAWQKTFLLVLGYMVPVLAGGSILGFEIMKIVYGELYSQAGPLFGLLLVAATLNTVVLLHMFLAVALEQRRRVLWAAGVGAVVNVLLNLGVIPFFGVLGAVVATIVATLTMLVLYRGLDQGQYYKEITQLPWVHIGHILTATAGMLIVVVGLRWVGVPTMVLIGIGAASYTVFISQLIRRLGYE